MISSYTNKLYKRKQRIRQKMYYEEHKEEIKQRQIAYNREHKEEIKEKRKAKQNRHYAKRQKSIIDTKKINILFDTQIYIKNLI